MQHIIDQISQCIACANTLLHHPRPVVQINPHSKIVIIGQAPGRLVHETGIPWNDKSGDTLRKWLNVSKEQFYNSSLFSLMGMGFCYPGKATSGDLPPSPLCAQLWHNKILSGFVNKPLVILVGMYAQKHYLNSQKFEGVTNVVKNFESYLPDYFVLPHPSPLNQLWVKKNPWFLDEVVPQLQYKVSQALIT